MESGLSYEQWKDEHCEREDDKLIERRSSKPLAVWRAFAAPVGEPLDIRVRWFTDAVDHGTLVAKVCGALEGVLRRTWQHAALAPMALLVQVVMNDRLGAPVSTSTSTPNGAPSEAPNYPRMELIARALTQLSGEAAIRHLPSAIYTAAVTAAGGIDGSFNVSSSTLDVDQVRRVLSAKLGEVVVTSFATAVYVAVFPDGSTSCLTEESPRIITEVASASGVPAMLSRDLLVVAREDLRCAEPMTIPSTWSG